MPWSRLGRVPALQTRGSGSLPGEEQGRKQRSWLLQQHRGISLPRHSSSFCSRGSSDRCYLPGLGGSGCWRVFLNLSSVGPVLAPRQLPEAHRTGYPTSCLTILSGQVVPSCLTSWHGVSRPQLAHLPSPAWPWPDRLWMEFEGEGGGGGVGWGCQPGTAPPGGCFPWGGRGGLFCTHFSFNCGSSVCPARQPVLLLRGVGWERKCRCHRSPQQRTMGSCCTMGTATTSRWSSTRAMCVSAVTRAATPALPSTGTEAFFRPPSCPQGLGGCQGGVS